MPRLGKGRQKTTSVWFERYVLARPDVVDALMLGGTSWLRLLNVRDYPSWARGHCNLRRSFQSFLLHLGDEYRAEEYPDSESTASVTEEDLSRVEGEVRCISF